MAAVLALAGTTWANAAHQDASSGSAPVAGAAASDGQQVDAPAVGHAWAAEGRRTHIFGPDSLPTTPIGIRKGGELLVHLDEQAGSTGLSWSPTHLPTNLTELYDEVVDGGGALGSPTDHVFRYRVSIAHNGSLSFALRKAGQAQDEKTVTFKIGTESSPTHQVIDVHGPDGLPAEGVKARIGTSP